VNGRYTSFMPRIKAEQNLNSIFGGDNPQGIWRLKVNDDANGDTGMVYAWGIQLNGEVLVGVEDPQNNSIPNKFELQQNYPNPFNPSTAIKFSIPKNLNVNLKVYDLAGREVASLINKELSAGSYEYLFDGSKLSSGVYFYKLTAGDFVDTKKMILVK
ncbi:MAG TPA: T9SS type A sorting domain-containing protein, partial [Ignavibacteria bacterium]|nr:T9SS type A sorting domain-containing protein [Ignavibacteria bacterium]